MNWSPRWLASVLALLLSGLLPTHAVDWVETSTSSSFSKSHCWENSQPSCWVTYTDASIQYKGYFSSREAATEACSSALGGWACGYASGEPGPPLMSGGWKVTCPGGVNQYGLCVSTLRQHATAYFPTLVVEQDVERPDDCRATGRWVGNPIDPLTGEKHEQITLPRWSPHAPPLTLHYRSGRFARQIGQSNFQGNNMLGLVPATGKTGAGIPDEAPPSPFGTLWAHALDSQVVRAAHAVRLVRIGGKGTLSFHGRTDGSAMLTSPDQADRLYFTGGVGGMHWLHRDPRTHTTQYFSASGRLIHQVRADGTQRVWLTHSDATTPRSLAAGPDRLLAVRDATGRQLRMVYRMTLAGTASDLIDSVVDDSGRATRFLYDATGRLVVVQWPDGTKQQLVYDPALPWALMARLDEMGVAIGNWRWDTANGLATSSFGADNTNTHQLRWAQPPSVQVVDSLEGPLVRRRYRWLPGSGVTVAAAGGDTRSLTAASVQGTLQVTQRSQPAGAGCDASTSVATLDANGNAVARDDFDGTRSCHAYDTTRNLERVRVEGLPRGTACAPLLAEGAALPQGSRKITTLWHPVWPLPEVVVSPGRIDYSIYNARPDPFANGQVASCMPRLDGSTQPGDDQPAPLCRKVVRATLDRDGGIGLAAPVDAAVVPWEERWTYTRDGLPASHDGPRTDVADLTFWIYHPVTMASARAGDLAEVRNAIGHSTRLLRWTATGELASFADPNQVRTDLAYDARGRLVLRTDAVGTPWERQTSHQWDPRGLLRQTALPGVSTGLPAVSGIREPQIINHTHDRAHRWIGQSGQGVRGVSLKLDTAGRVVARTIQPGGSDPPITVRWDYDALHRPWREWVTIHGMPWATTFGRDPVGRLTSVQRPAVRANLETSAPREQRQYDRLGRLARLDLAGTGVQTAVSLTHDLLDRPTSVISGQGARFEFQRDGLGQQQLEVGPDTGRTVRQFDASGNLVRVSDALGTTVHSHDAMNRRISTMHQRAGQLDAEHVRYTWDSNPGAGLACTHGAGRLCRIDDAAGSRHFAYDPFGRLSEQWTVELGQTHRQSFVWDAEGRLLGSADHGGAMAYWRDGDGLVRRIQATTGGAPITVVEHSGVRLDGGSNETRQSNGITVVRRFDTSGKLISQTDNARAGR